MPKNISFKYNSKISSLVNILSILKANKASLIFLFKDTSLLSKKFFANCWVIVEAPTNLFPSYKFLILIKTALLILWRSTPLCSKKFLSSADTKAFFIVSGIESIGIKILFSAENSANKVPFPVYNLLIIEGV